MKAFLLQKDRDFELKSELPWNEPALSQDLELDTLFYAMAGGDRFLFEVAKAAIVSSLSNDLDTILYRQKVLKDGLRHPSIIRELYAIAVEGVESEKKGYWGLLAKYPVGILNRSLELLRLQIPILARLRQVAEDQANKFESEGFKTLFAMVSRELSAEYFASIQDHLNRLKFRDGALISAELGKGNKGTNYVLRRTERQSWLKRMLPPTEPVYSYHLHPRDDAGARALAELNDRGINLVANALAQSTDHILSFFQMLRTELAFYVGCLNLHHQLARKGEPNCFPLPAHSGERKHSFVGLYDVCLALRLEQSVVGNDIAADNKNLVVITGANQGGKSTFLRSIGSSQLMMQAGMFVPANSFSANICNRLFTHYRREEDVTMKSGKLDEELSRMSEIVDDLTTDSLLLFNESFAATNEREGSEIARHIVSPLLEKRIKIFFVTHLYEFARCLYDRKMENATFRRAERQPDGTRTFKLVEGEPLETSFGPDLYEKIFGADALFSG